MGDQNAPADEKAKLEEILREIRAPEVKGRVDEIETEWSFRPSNLGSRYGCCQCREGRGSYCYYCERQSCETCRGTCSYDSSQSIYSHASTIRERIIDMLEQEEKEEESENGGEDEDGDEESNAKRPREDRAAYWNEKRENWVSLDDYGRRTCTHPDDLIECIERCLEDEPEIQYRLRELQSNEEHLIASNTPYWSAEEFQKVAEYVKAINERLEQAQSSKKKD